MSNLHAARNTRESGASLFVVMILLLVMTLLGLAVLRGTLLQERMTANLYDRSLSFQSAEAALRAAEQEIETRNLQGQTVIGVDCSALNVVCPSMPANAFTGAGAWTTIASDQVLSAGSPQYYIEYMGKYTSEDDLGLASSANLNQYGGGGGVPLRNFYRITARSQSPVNAERSVVVLQSSVVVK